MSKNMVIKKGDKVTLSNLRAGQKGRVISLNIEKKEIRRHLLDMGITKGTEIVVKKIAPMGDPVDIELRGYELCIRKDETKNIYIEVL